MEIGEKDNHPSFDSSDSVSSSETYIEETDFFVVNGEEENRLWDAKGSRSKGEEEEDEQCPHKAKMIFMVSLSKNTRGQWKEEKAITKAEKKGYKGLEGVDLPPDSDFGGRAALLGNSEQAELAEVVMDVECKNKLFENVGVLGLEKVEARLAEGPFSAQQAVEVSGSVLRAMEEDSRRIDLSRNTYVMCGSSIGGTKEGDSKAVHLAISEGRIVGDREPMSGL